MPLIQWIMQNLVREKRACVSPLERIETDINIAMSPGAEVLWKASINTDVDVEYELYNEVLISKELDATIDISLEECCSMNNIGDDMRVTGTWTDLTGARVDPTSVQAVVRSPSGIETTYTWPATITRTSIGVFYLTVDITASGTWRGRFVSTGSGKAVEFFSFVVNENEF